MFVETERLIVREFVEGDWTAVLAYTANPDVMRYIPEGVFTPEMAQAFVRKQMGPEVEAYAVVLRGEERLIGHIIFHPWFAPRTFEVGWVMHPGVHGRGYATEAARAVLARAFDQLDAHRVIATCQPENPASYRVMEKLGMRREGLFRQCIHRGGDVWWDEYFYAILAAEWRGRSS